MNVVIRPNALQPFQPGRRVVFSVETDDPRVMEKAGTCSDLPTPAPSVPIAERACHWTLIRLRGPDKPYVGFQLPNIFAPEIAVEFPVEEGLWLLTAQNKNGQSYEYRYVVGPLTASPQDRSPAPLTGRKLSPEALANAEFANDPQRALEALRRAVALRDILDKAGKPVMESPRDIVSVATVPAIPAKGLDLRRALARMEKRMAASGIQPRIPVRARFYEDSPGVAKSRTLKVFATRMEDTWALVDWTDFGTNSLDGVHYDNRTSPEGLRANGRARNRNPVDVQFEAALDAWKGAWPYGEGFLDLSVTLEGKEYRYYTRMDRPKESHALEYMTNATDAIALIGMVGGLFFPPLEIVGLIAGVASAGLRMRRTQLEGGDILSENLMDVLFLACLGGKAISGALAQIGSRVGTFSRGAEVTVQSGARYLSFISDSAGYSNLVLMTLDSYAQVYEVMDNPNLTADEKLYAISKILAMQGLNSALIGRSILASKGVTLSEVLRNPKAKIRDSEILRREGHTNERENKTVAERRNERSRDRLHDDNLDLAPENTQKKTGTEGVNAREETIKGTRPFAPLEDGTLKTAKTESLPREVFLLGVMADDKVLLERSLLRKTKNEHGAVDIFVHGNPESIAIFDQTVKNNARHLSPAEFLDYLKSEYGYAGEDINLMACSTGKSENGFAAEFSRLAKAKVWAPTEILTVAPDGFIFASSRVETSIIEYPKKPGESPGPNHRKIRKIPVWPPDGKLKLFDGSI